MKLTYLLDLCMHHCRTEFQHSICHSSTQFLFLTTQRALHHRVVHCVHTLFQTFIYGLCLYRWQLITRKRQNYIDLAIIVKTFLKDTWLVSNILPTCHVRKTLKRKKKKKEWGGVRHILWQCLSSENKVSRIYQFKSTERYPFHHSKTLRFWKMQ